MFLIFILIANLLLITAEQDLFDGTCDAAVKSCQSDLQNDDTKFLFYDVNPPEGFNLRRDVFMRFAIMMSETHKKGKKLNWRLVLPPWYRLYHWRSQRKIGQPLPWSTFFDVDSLKSFAPVIELNEILSNETSDPLEIDTVFVLQNYEDPFEGGIFVDKWQVIKDNCRYDGDFWGYANVKAKEVVCVRFQGQISRLWELISLHPSDKKVMFAHGEIALHDSYGTKNYWDCRKSMKFNENLVKTAENYIEENLNCTEMQCQSYMAVHWRRQDFARSRRNDVPSLHGTIQQIDSTVRRRIRTIKKIFIASDAPYSELNLLRDELRALKYEVFFYSPSKKELELFKDGGVAIIDQIICSHAAYFIGTHESTFSFRIQEEREILGFNSDTTFNRLCPDSGVCEKPSRWTIIH